MPVLVRLAAGSPIVDLLQIDSEPVPKAGMRVLCRHPFFESKRVYVTPAKVEKLLHLYWDGKVIVMPGAVAGRARMPVPLHVETTSSTCAWSHLPARELRASLGWRGAKLMPKAVGVVIATVPLR